MRALHVTQERHDELSLPTARPSVEDLGGDLATRVGEVLRPFMALEQCSVGPASRLVEDLGLDSLAVARSILALEATFEVEIPENRLHAFKTATVADVASLIAEARTHG